LPLEYSFRAHHAEAKAPASNAAAKILLRAELRRQVCFDQVARQPWPHDLCSDAHHVHVIVLENFLGYGKDRVRELLDDGVTR